MTNQPAKTPTDSHKSRAELIATQLSSDTQNKIDGQIQDAIDNIRDIDEIRILKDRGFFGVTLPVSFRVPSTDAQDETKYHGAAFIANRPYEVIEVQERHELSASLLYPFTASTVSFTVGAALTGQTNKETAVIDDVLEVIPWTGENQQFIVGQTAIGASSNAQGLIANDVSTGPGVGYLVLTGVTGTFLNGETVNDQNGAAATVSEPVGGYQGRLTLHSLTGMFEVGETITDTLGGTGKAGSVSESDLSLLFPMIVPSGESVGHSSAQNLLFTPGAGPGFIMLNTPGNTIQKFTHSSKDTQIWNVNDTLREGDAIFIQATGPLNRVSTVSVSFLLKAI